MSLPDDLTHSPGGDDLGAVILAVNQHESPPHGGSGCQPKPFQWLRS